jgi:hypothetical protein
MICVQLQVEVCYSNRLRIGDGGAGGDSLAAEAQAASDWDSELGFTVTVTALAALPT